MPLTKGQRDIAVQPERPTNIRWSVFAVALATSAILYLHRYSFSFVKPALAKEWGLSNLELAKFDSAFASCYSLFQFPVAVAADLLGVRLVLTLLAIVWCGGLVLLAYAPSGRWVAAAQALTGTGQSAVYACLARISRVWYPPTYRTTWQGVVSVLAGRLGAIGASLVFSTLLLGVFGLPWRVAVGIFAAMAGVLAIAIAVILRDSPAGDVRVNQAERQLIEGTEPSATAVEPITQTETIFASPSTGFWQRLPPRTIVTLVALAVQAILSTFADNIYSNWLPQFLAQVHHLEFKSMGIYAALPLLGGAVAGFVGGVLNDRLIRRTGSRRWARAGVAIAGKGLAAVVLLVALTQYDRPYVFCGMLFLVKALGDWSLVSALGVITDIGGRATASVFALINTIAGIGQITAPLVFGYVADHHGWHPVFVLVAITYALCACSWLAIGSDGAQRDTSSPSNKAPFDSGERRFQNG